MDQLTLGEISTAWTSADFLLQCHKKSGGRLLDESTRVKLDTLRADLGAARDEFGIRDAQARAVATRNAGEF